MKVSSRRAFARAGQKPIHISPVFTRAQLAIFTSVAVAFPVLILAVRSAG